MISKGAEVIAVQEFVPDSDMGMVEVPIEFDPATLKDGERVVVIENIYDKSTSEEIEAGVQTEDIHILAHEDLNNLEQSLNVTSLPKITDIPEVPVIPPMQDTPDIPPLGDIPENELVICLGVSFVVIGAVSLVIAIEVKRNRIYKN